jgi:hypothetical protein
MTTNARDAGYTMPAEWAPHERCWMAWPCDSHWDSGPGLDTIRGVITDVARAIRRFEPLTMLANPDDVEGARSQLGPDIEVLRMVYNSEWLRDSGPSFVVDGKGGLGATCWHFNAWGGKGERWDDDVTFDYQIGTTVGTKIRDTVLVVERHTRSIAVQRKAEVVSRAYGVPTVRVRRDQCVLAGFSRTPAMPRAEPQCPLLPRKRTLAGLSLMSACDPERTSRLAACGGATVDLERRARDVTRIVRGKIGDRLADFLWRCKAFHG